jgi:hypothetical protein
LGNLKEADKEREALAKLDPQMAADLDRFINEEKKQEPKQREAVDLAQLAQERFLADSRVGQQYLTTLDDLPDHIARDPQCPVVNIDVRHAAPAPRIFLESLRLATTQSCMGDLGLGLNLRSAAITFGVLMAIRRMTGRLNQSGAPLGWPFAESKIHCQPSLIQTATSHSLSRPSFGL